MPGLLRIGDTTTMMRDGTDNMFDTAVPAAARRPAAAVSALDGTINELLNQVMK
jgi:hypothetical protein